MKGQIFLSEKNIVNLSAEFAHSLVVKWTCSNISIRKDLRCPFI